MQKRLSVPAHLHISKPQLCLSSLRMILRECFNYVCIDCGCFSYGFSSNCVVQYLCFGVFSTILTFVVGHFMAAEKYSKLAFVLSFGEDNL